MPYVPYIRLSKVDNQFDINEDIRADRIERVTTVMLDQVEEGVEGSEDPGMIQVAVTAVHLVGKTHPVMVTESPDQVNDKIRRAWLGGDLSSN